jgi:hypothetical protein
MDIFTKLVRTKKVSLSEGWEEEDLEVFDTNIVKLSKTINSFLSNKNVKVDSIEIDFKVVTSMLSIEEVLDDDFWLDVDLGRI